MQHAVRAVLSFVLALTIVHGAPASASSIPFTVVDVRPFVAVAVNGNPARFLVDTGAGGGNAMSNRLADALGLTMRSAAPVAGANARRLNVSEAIVDRFVVGPIVMRHVVFTVADFTPLERRIGFRLDGIVASAALTTHRIRFDGPRRTIDVDPRAALHGTTVPMRTADGWPIVDASVDGVRGAFLIDTGDRSFLTLFTPFARAHYPPAKRPLRAVVTGFGLVSPIVTDLTRTRLSVAGLEVPDDLTRLATQTAGGFASAALAGSIGAATFLHDVVEFDYPRHRFTVAPGGHRPRSEWDRAGMWLSRGDGALVVDAVVPNGPAARAGLRVGDRLVAIEGRDARAVDLPVLRARLASADPGLLRVTLRQHDKDTIVVVRPRALI